MSSLAAPLQPAPFGDHSTSQGMLHDIHGTPEALRNILKQYLKPDEGGSTIELPTMNAKLPDGHQFAGKTPLEVMTACAGQGTYKNKFIIIGGGTSYHAALVAEYLIETVCRIPVEVQYASEYRYRKPCFSEGDILVIVSSSGETVDAVESLRLVKKEYKDVLTVAVVNETQSTIARESDATISIHGGSEEGVASTKAFSCTVTTFVLLATALGEASGVFSAKQKMDLLTHLRELPKQVETVIERESKALRTGKERRIDIGECAVWDIGCQNVLASNFIFLGRGFNFPIALEGAMKLKEIAYIHAEGYPAAEMKHGPIALIDQFMPVVVIAPKSDETYEKIKSNIEEVKARNGACIAITEDGNTELQEICEHVISVPSTHEYLMPLLTVVPLQLLAYIMGVVRGNDVNQPRGLRKTVTTDMDSSA